MKAKKSSINRRLLNKMTEIAPQMEEKPKPMLHMTGKEAKMMHGMKPGAKVKMAVHGRIMNVGFQEYGPDKGKPEANVEIHGMKMIGGKKDMEGKMEDQMESEEE